MQRFPPGHPESFALSDREVLNAIVLAQNGSIGQNDLAFLGAR